MLDLTCINWCLDHRQKILWWCLEIVYSCSNFSVKLFELFIQVAKVARFVDVFREFFLSFSVLSLEDFYSVAVLNSIELYKTWMTSKETMPSKQNLLTLMPAFELWYTWNVQLNCVDNLPTEWPFSLKRKIIVKKYIHASSISTDFTHYQEK